jgi:hypothetical protein
MNPQEREQLTRFLNQLAEVQVPEKVSEADALIRETVAKQPDAAYLLVQRSLLLEQALNQAKAQIADLQKQLQTTRMEGKGGFLGANPWAQNFSQPPASGAVPGAGDYQISRGAPAAPLASAASGGASFLGNLASTAAGVVAGSFLFQGIENLLGQHHTASPWGNSGGEALSDQTVINNYDGSDPHQDAAAQQDDDAGSFLASEDDLDAFQDDSDDSTWV